MKHYRMPRGIRNRFKEAGILLIYVTEPGQANRIGIHLLLPSVKELEDALEKAERDLFPAVYIHNFATWGYQGPKPTPQERRAHLTLIIGGAA